MRYKNFYLSLFMAFAMAVSTPVFSDTIAARGSYIESTESLLKPPKAHKKTYETTLHGITLADDYFWMRMRDNPHVLPEILSYLKAWNAYTDSYLVRTKHFQEKLYGEMISRIQESSSTYPYRVGGYLYYSRMEKGQDYPVFCRKKVGIPEKEEIILDQNEWARDYPYFKVFSINPNLNGDHIAFVIDTQGTAIGTVFILESVEDAFVMRELIPQVNEAIIWNHNGKGLWHAHVNEELRSDKVYYHLIGTAVSEDRCLYEEADELVEIQMTHSNDEQFVFITSHASSTTEVRFGLIDDPDAELVLVQPRQDGVQYFVEGHEDRFYIRSKEGVDNFGVWTTLVSRPARKNWNLLIPSDPKTNIVSIHAFQNHLVILKEEDALTKLEVRDISSGASHEIQMPDQVFYSVSLEDNHEYKTRKLHLSYTSVMTPMTLFEYDMALHELHVLQEEKIEGFDPSLYTTERIYAYLNDGTRIPLSLFYNKKVAREGNAPLLLHGYGAYGFTIEHTYSPWLVSMADRGIYAFAHVRGGGDCGYRWYEEGRMMNKMNTFTDFIACAEHLIKQGYTSPGRLAVYGRSAGGLLIGAVLNMRPELFKAALAEVPFLDVVNSMSDRTLSLTKLEEGEWGSCYDEQSFKYILRYSPYDNIKRQHYPSILVTGGWHDHQVFYWEPAKWASKLLAHKTDNNPLLLHVNMEGGHVGHGGRYEHLQDKAMKLAFLLWELGVTE